MADSTEVLVRSLVRNLYYATEGKALWWSLPHKLNSSTWDGIQKATDRGWMLQDGSSVCLTDAGRELVENWLGSQIPKSAAQLIRPASSYVS